MPTTNFTGSAVLDERGDKIGEVSDVIYDEFDPSPTWLIVKPGFLRAEHYVPARGSYRTENNDLVVPYGLDLIKSATKAKGDHVLTEEERRTLSEHYHLEL